ncbi:hypothetical protein W97_04860 [Coniosporium apollinis CBS 100218]|uniref:Uncharacterized protein n=1 Tax=Coniosporium apollinis (strain CBS 100218) TaxID=1168221 RepID=R7YVF8_CONA1|nr:uncharacterized protein W97_04860 [Coniosporium apollinis CBS 100218]EON65621.1 hypothetical protein W97_04860 [Coniosporium apollinis CBS 100218]
MSSTDLSARNKSVQLVAGQADGRRSGSRGRDGDHTPTRVTPPRGKKGDDVRARDVTPKSGHRESLRRTSESTPARVPPAIGSEFIIGGGAFTPTGARSPKPDLDAEAQNDWQVVKKNQKTAKRRASQATVHHFAGPILQAKIKPTISINQDRAASHAGAPKVAPRTKSVPAIVLSRECSSQSPFTYADALTGSGLLAPRATIETTPAWAVQRLEAAKTLPVTRREKNRAVMHDGIIQGPSAQAKSPISRPLEPAPEGAGSIDDGSDDTSSESNAAWSVVDQYPDSATDGTSTSVSMESLRSDIDPDERLVSPRQYFQELESLEATVAGKSSLFLMRKVYRTAYPEASGFKLKISYVHFGEMDDAALLRKQEDTIVEFCAAFHKASNRASGRSPRSAKMQQADLAYWAFHMLECRNLVHGVVLNIRRMRNAHYCNEAFNVLTVSRTRRGVATLVRFDVNNLERLHSAFMDALVALTSELERPQPKWTARLEELTQGISRTCGQFMDRLDLAKSTDEVGEWRKTIFVLDLAVVSYCGAHIERFDLSHFGEDLDRAKIAAALTYITDGSEGIMLRRRTLRCLDAFLGGRRVWVLQSQALWEDDAELYLSTGIADFADIWGPVWGVKKKENSTGILRYNAGPGSILPWPADATTPLAPGEEFCHWVGLDDPQNRSDRSLHENAKLLIGAPSSSTVTEQKTSQMKENLACNNKPQKVMQQLRSANQLEELGTSPESVDLAEEIYGASVGAYGMSIGGEKVYKRRSGVYLKDAICEAWRNEGMNRNPAVLEEWLGVEVSFCSRNARRRRLKSILDSTTVRNWLEACMINSEPFACEKAFDEALRSPNKYAFRELYEKNRQWRKGQLVSWCLDGLRHSSVDKDGTLRALWIPEPYRRIRVKLPQSVHSWTGFLADTESSSTMAVMYDGCLHTDYRDGSTCQARYADVRHSLHTILETALEINPDAKIPKELELRRSRHEKHDLPRYSIRNVRRNEKFQIPHGRLRVVEPFRSTRLVVTWEGGVSKKLHQYADLVVRTISKESPPHWELRVDDWCETKPIPLFIKSEYPFECKR